MGAIGPANQRAEGKQYNEKALECLAREAPDIILLLCPMRPKIRNARAFQLVGWGDEIKECDGNAYWVKQQPYNFPAFPGP